VLICCCDGLKLIVPYSPEPKRNAELLTPTIIIIIIYKVKAFWPVPISRLGELIHPSPPSLLPFG
jgi:hypothetical protein